MHRIKIEVITETTKCSKNVHVHILSAAFAQLGYITCFWQKSLMNISVLRLIKKWLIELEYTNRHKNQKHGQYKGQIVSSLIFRRRK